MQGSIQDSVRDSKPGFLRDEAAWADFLLSKAALALASFVLFAALFHLAAGFKDVESQEGLDTLARDFKAAVDEAGTGNFRKTPGQDTSEPSIYRFDESGLGSDFLFNRGLEVSVSGEYVRLDAEVEGKLFRAVKPLTFRTLPLNEAKLREELRTRFGADGSREEPVSTAYSELGAFLSLLGTRETVLDPGQAVCIRKEFIYVREKQEVSTIGCTLVYQ